MVINTYRRVESSFFGTRMIGDAPGLLEGAIMSFSCISFKSFSVVKPLSDWSTLSVNIMHYSIYLYDLGH